jgi:hypothetical protein
MYGTSDLAEMWWMTAHLGGPNSRDLRALRRWPRDILSGWKSVNIDGKNELCMKPSLYRSYARRQEAAFSAFGMHVVEQDDAITHACRITDGVYRRLE